MWLLGWIYASKELSLNHKIALFLDLGLGLFFNLRLNALVVGLLFPWLNQLFCFHQLLPSLLSYFGSILYFLLLYFFFNFLFIILFSSFLGAEHAFQIFISLVLIESDGSCAFLFLVLKALIILTHLHSMINILFYSQNYKNISKFSNICDQRE